jgi:hypothetical protein
LCSISQSFTHERCPENGRYSPVKKGDGVPRKKDRYYIMYVMGVLPTKKGQPFSGKA